MLVVADLIEIETKNTCPVEIRIKTHFWGQGTSEFISLSIVNIFCCWKRCIIIKQIWSTSPLFDEETIFNEHIDDKEHTSLYYHGKDITACHVPAKRIFHQVLAWKIVSKYYKNNDTQSLIEP